MSRRLIPLLDRILVSRVAAPTKSAGGVLLPESAVNKVNEGVVIAAGPGRRDDSGNLIPMDVKEGDTVVLPDYGGHALKLEGKELHVFRADEVLGILKDDKS
ncbi:unnamed protein product [Ostreobium quekettii]|uniref:Protein groES n=1 Tax=Ostreobium quekettii TaxID=121088 RepID=A0A8S1J845_9CHLO|nr:unnamed protein product [Ostreobium quekettii]